jgi:LruC domain-containing protein
MKSIKSKILALVLSFSGASTATDEVNGEYVWQFLSGQAWPGGYIRDLGKPENLIWARNEYSDDFFARINNALPERELNEAFITDDAGSTITLTEQAEVFVTFIHEGAGYRNAFGYFLFDANNPPTTKEDVDEVIIFPNLSYPHMANGHRLSIGTFPAGTSIGFVLAANGYSWWTGVKSQTNLPLYYSLKDLNPESIDVLRQHMALLYDEEVQEVILGFEDLPRTWGDNDFNDAIFSVKTTPETAIDTTSLISVPEVNDADADGVTDELDEFPNDYRRAYSSYFPSNSSYVTLAFEDNWPKVGDYDMNDLVVQERLQTIYDADGNITGMKIEGAILARGASHVNGFAMRLMGVAPEEIGESSITINGQEYAKFTENFQTDAVIQLWSNTNIFTETNESGQCQHFNTLKSCTEFPTVPFTLDIEFTSSLAQLNHSSLDFFIFRTNDRSLEIHFAGYPPTDLFNFDRFGTQDDTSSVETGRYFKNAQNLPWGIKLSDKWPHPREYIDIVWAYPDYETWVESSGNQATNWYKTSNRKSHFYERAGQ